MTASQMADGNHTFKIRLVEEVKRENVFYRSFYGSKLMFGKN